MNFLSLGPIVVLVGKRLATSFRFDSAAPNSALVAIEYGMSQSNISSDYRFFQKHLESVLGKPHLHWREKAHYDVEEYIFDAWKYGDDVIAFHSVTERMMAAHGFIVSKEKHVNEFITSIGSQQK